MDTTQEDSKNSIELKAAFEHEQLQKQQHSEYMQYQQQQQQQTHLRHLQQQVQRFHAEALSEETVLARKRKLYAIEEHQQNEEEDEEERSSFAAKAELAAPDAAYDADVDDDVLPPVGGGCVGGGVVAEPPIAKTQKLQSEREHIFELFQPWALKTYGDQAKTKTITLRKKARILKALEGKEHSRPDSSKFRFWVKTKAFTTKRPEGFEEAPGSQRRFQPLPPNAVLSDSPGEVDLYVGSTNKDFGKRTYRKVAVVEEFFDIIYNVHMELGGRSGMHAGQKRTYRIITETYGFLPREAVTRFLSTCPECKKNLRPSSPTTSSHNDEPPQNESSSELEVLNYSSHTESSLEAGPATKSSAKPTTQASIAAVSIPKKRRNSYAESTIKATSSTQQTEVTPKRRDSSPTQAQTMSSAPPMQPLQHLQQPLQQQTQRLQHTKQQLPASMPKIRINPQLQRPITPPSSAMMIDREAPPPPLQPMNAYAYHPLCFDMNASKMRSSGGVGDTDSLFRYYEFMRRFYAGGGVGGTAGSGGFMPTVVQPPLPSSLAPPLYGSDLMQSLRFPSASLTKAQATPISTIETHVDKPTLSTIDLSIDDDDDDDGEVADVQACVAPTLKKFKAESAHSFKAHSLAIAAFDDARQTADETQTSAINLSKSFFNFRSNGTPPPPDVKALPPQPTTPISPPTATTSTPLAIKFEASPSSTLSACAPLRIPQLRTQAQSVAALPPLDLERLKPITSTYLQLTRSMGLTDEDALRFDNLVSKDFKYSL